MTDRKLQTYDSHEEFILLRSTDMQYVSLDQLCMSRALFSKLRRHFKIPCKCGQFNYLEIQLRIMFSIDYSIWSLNEYQSLTYYKIRIVSHFAIFFVPGSLLTINREPQWWILIRVRSFGYDCTVWIYLYSSFYSRQTWHLNQKLMFSMRKLWRINHLDLLWIYHVKCRKQCYSKFL